MRLIVRALLATLLGACTVPSFGIAPDDSGTDPVQKDPCTIQKEAGQLCGGDCAACTNGASCTAAADCASGICDTGTCVAAPSCTDGITNGTETDLDCGGSCDPCPLDEHCTHDSDCSSSLCMASKCATPVLAPTCTDGAKNDTESDIDCGGSCSPCALNKRCNSGTDCVSLSCASVCQPPSCSDMVRNGAESDKDCGGSCAGCAVGLVCNTGADCASGSCASGHCIAPSCTDKVKNGDETGADCGGSCPACSATLGCAKTSDCQSLVCTNKVCATATCTDGVLNGTESSTDCGKGCSGCALGLHCNSATDCASGVCKQNYCVSNAPTGGTLVNTGWVATATSTASNSDTSQAIDGKLNDRWASGASQVPGMWFEVDMTQPQIFWGITLDATTQTTDTPQLFDVYLSLDGTFKTPIVMSVTTDATAISHVTFSSAQVARYIKIVLSANKSSWWSIGELEVNK